MINRRYLLTASAVSFLFLAGGCGRSTPDYRYRLTIEVETPEGLRSGSGVLSVRSYRAGEYSIPTPGAISHRLRGQAVMVDLGRRGTLFALLCSDVDVDWPKTLMFRLTPRLPKAELRGLSSRERDERQYAAMLARRQPIEVPRYFPDIADLRNVPGWPVMVRIGEFQDPTTIVRADPDDLAPVFGEGVRIKRIIAQMTDDPVTLGIEKKLPWLLDFNKRHPEMKNYRGGFEPQGTGGPDANLREFFLVRSY